MREKRELLMRMCDRRYTALREVVWIALAAGRQIASAIFKNEPQIISPSQVDSIDSASQIHKFSKRQQLL